MIARILGLSILVVMTITFALRAAATPKDEVKSVAKALESTFKQLDPAVKPEFEERGESLSASYLTQTFKIHGIGKSGIISKEAHDEVGPSHKGFVLNVHMQPKGEVNQAVTPQTIRRPYWLTDLNITPLAKSDTQLYWGLSYGDQTDKMLLDEIRQSIKLLGE